VLVEGETRALPATIDATVITADDTLDSCWRRVDWLAVAVIAVVSIVAVSLFTQAYPTFSPIDELQHLDYAVKAGNFELVADGDQMGQTALHAFSCVGVDSPGYLVHGPCEAPFLEPYHFPDHGYNTAALQLPVYYTITGVVGRALDAASPLGVLTAMRVTGALWLTLALALTWAIGAELGIARRQRAVALALLAPAVQVLFTSSTVNADNALMVGGGLVVLAVIRADRGASSWWWVIGASVVAVALEPTSALAVGGACVFILVRAASRSRGDERRGLVGRSLCVGAATAASILFFDLVRDAFIGGRIPPDLPRYRELFAPGLESTAIVDNLSSLVTPISEPYVPHFLRSELTTNLNSLIALALVGLVVAVLVTHRWRSPRGALAGALLAVMVLSGPLLVLYLYVHSNVYFAIPSRYGLSMMPALMAVSAAALARRPVRWGVGAVAAAHAVHMGALLGVHA
jgi:hypothetical protein